MDLQLEGKGFLVLGASRGLGRAVAEALAGEGAHVLLGPARRRRSPAWPPSSASAPPGSPLT
jgi:3-oxoacyl-[acyl-carrier protein] reductase